MIFLAAFGAAGPKGDGRPTRRDLLWSASGRPEHEVSAAGERPGGEHHLGLADNAPGGTGSRSAVCLRAAVALAAAHAAAGEQSGRGGDTAAEGEWERDSNLEEEVH